MSTLPWNVTAEERPSVFLLLKSPSVPLTLRDLPMAGGALHEWKNTPRGHHSAHAATSIPAPRPMSFAFKQINPKAILKRLSNFKGEGESKKARFFQLSSLQREKFSPAGD